MNVYIKKIPQTLYKPNQRRPGKDYNFFSFSLEELYLNGWMAWMAKKLAQLAS